MSLVFTICWILSSGSSLEASRDQNFLFWKGLLTSTSSDLQINALQKMGDLQRPEAVPEISVLLSSENPELRYHAARSLARIPHEKSLQALSARLPREEDVYVRAEINRSLRVLREFQSRVDSRAEPSPEEGELMED